LKILLTGCAGQVGSALRPALAPLGEVHAFDRHGLNLLDSKAVGKTLAALNPDLIVNAAAYTAVDRAERDEDAVFALNARAVDELARGAKSVGALLVHFSTDYVFDGEKDSPYAETDAPNPQNVYGRSKLEGERAIAASGCRYFIFRTSWVYAARGRNFLQAILAAAKEKPELKVVNDQRGAPTSAEVLAGAIAKILASERVKGRSGLYHLSAAGETSWHGFADAILRAKGLDIPLVAIPSDEFPVAAKRPKNSLLDNARVGAEFGVVLPDWRQSLAAVLAAIH